MLPLALEGPTPSGVERLAVAQCIVTHHRHSVVPAGQYGALSLPIRVATALFTVASGQVRRPGTCRVCHYESDHLSQYKIPMPGSRRTGRRRCGDVCRHGGCGLAAVFEERHRPCSP